MPSRRDILIGMIILAMRHTSPTLALTIDISPSGSRRISIAIADFIANSQSETTIARGVTANIEADLIDGKSFDVVTSKTYVGADTLPDFSLWRSRGVIALIVGRVSGMASNRVRIEFRLWDVAAGKQITGGQHFVDLDNWLPAAHLISEAVTKALQ